MSYVPRSQRQRIENERFSNVIALSFALQEKKVTAYLREDRIETLKPVVRVLCRDEITLRKSTDAPTFDAVPRGSVYMLFKGNVTLAYDSDSKEVRIFP